MYLRADTGARFLYFACLGIATHTAIISATITPPTCPMLMSTFGGDGIVRPQVRAVVRDRRVVVVAAGAVQTVVYRVEYAVYPGLYMS